jgi:hypothetical protein
VIHLAVALFFTAALLAAAVSIHLTVKLYWSDILLALRGELGLRTTVPQAQPYSGVPRPRAA